MTTQELYEHIETYGWKNFVRLISNGNYTANERWNKRWNETDEYDLPFEVEVVGLSANLHQASGETIDRKAVVKINDEYFAIEFNGDSWDQIAEYDSFTVDKVVPKEKTITEWVSA